MVDSEKRRNDLRLLKTTCTEVASDLSEAMVASAFVPFGFAPLALRSSLSLSHPRGG